MIRLQNFDTLHYIQQYKSALEIISNTIINIGDFEHKLTFPIGLISGQGSFFIETV